MKIGIPFVGLAGGATACVVVLCSVLWTPSAEAQEKQPKEVTSLLADFGKDVDRVHEPKAKTLQAQGSKVVAGLLRENAPDEANLTGQQIADKVAGKAVDKPHPSIATLFEQFDKALAADLKPIQERYVKRVDILIKASEGKDLAMVMALANAKKVIEQADVQPAEAVGASPDSADSMPKMKGRHDPTGQSWATGSKATVYTFSKGGKGERTDTGVKQPFTWKANSKGEIELEGSRIRPRVLAIDASGKRATVIVRDTGEATTTLELQP